MVKPYHPDHHLSCNTIIHQNPLTISKTKFPSILPQPHLLIPSPTRHNLPITTPINRVHLVLVPRQILHQAPRLHLPHLDSRVLGRTDQQPRVRREAQHVHRAHVSAQRAQVRPVVGGPEFHAVVEGGGGDDVPGGREGGVGYLLLVPEETGLGFGCRRGAVGQVGPEIDCVVVGGGEEAFCGGSGEGGGGFEAGFREGSFGGV